MEAETRQQGQATISKQLPELPFSSSERMICGGSAGLLGGLLAGVIAGDMEGAFIGGVLLALLLGATGAVCGAVSCRSGWMAVQPLVWAVVGGVALHIDRPT